MYGRLLPALLMSSVLITPSLGDDNKSVTLRSASAVERARSKDRARFHLLSYVLDAPVSGQRGEELGRLEDIGIDMKTDRLAFAIVSADDKLYALPFGVISDKTKANASFGEAEFVASISKDKLGGAEGFDRTRWPDLADARFGRTVYSYFGEKPYWEPDTGRARLEGEPISNEAQPKKRSSPQAGERQMLNASKDMLDARIESESGKLIGTVRELLIDTENDRLAILVVKFADGVRLGREKASGKLAAIPWCRCAFDLKLTRDKQPVIILNWKLDVLQGHTMGEEQLPYLTNPQTAEQTYRVYGKDPYWLMTSSESARR